MSYNGSGTFQINSTGQPVVTGTVISSTAFNALTADLATGLSTAITKDGQTTTTARILFAQGISSTPVTDATSATTGSIITAGGISTQKALWVGTTSRFVGNIQADGNLQFPGQTAGLIGIPISASVSSSNSNVFTVNSGSQMWEVSMQGGYYGAFYVVISTDAFGNIRSGSNMLSPSYCTMNFNIGTSNILQCASSDPAGTDTWTGWARRLR